MYNKCPVIFTVLIACTLNCSATDDIGNYHFQHLSMPGISQDINIRSAYQDNLGYMWFGIETAGLCKFNGHHFTAYKHNFQDSNSISNNFINGITEDTNNNLWLITENGLNIFNIHQESFKKYYVPDLLSNKLEAIHRDQSGTIWVGSSKGLMKFVPTKQYDVDHQNCLGDCQGKKYGYVMQQDFITEALRDKYINCIFEENQYSFWIGTNSGLYHFDIGKSQISKWHHRPSNPTGLSNNEVRAFNKLSNNLYLVGTDNGLNLLDIKANTCKRVEFGESGLFNKAKVGISTIYKDSHNVLWIGTNSYGIVTTSPTNLSKEISNKFHMPHSVKGISKNHIKKIFEDEAGQLWVISKFGGAFHYDRRLQMFPHYSLTEQKINQHEVNKNNFILCATNSLDNNHIWIGTKFNGLFHYNLYRHTATKKIVLDRDSEPIRRIECLYQDNEYNIWIGHKEGVTQLHSITGKEIHYPLPKVFQIKKDTAGTLWFGTQQGIYYFNEKLNKITRFDRSNLIFFEKSDLDVRVIAEDNNGRIWFGTNSNGIYVYVPDHQSIKHLKYHPNPYRTNSLSGNTIRAIYEDHYGNMWIGTKSAGLNRYTHGSDTITYFGLKAGLPSNTVFSITGDDGHNLWLTTNKGISKFNPVTLQFQNFNIQHGLQSNIFEPRAWQKLPNGMLFAGGYNGFNLFNPKRIKKCSYQPQLVINEIKINDKRIPVDFANDQNITIPYHTDVFSIDFSALDFRNPEDIQYAYQLEGVDKDWVYSNNRNHVTYTKVPHGHYTFRFKATNSDGLWMKTFYQIKIKVIRPPWLTLEAYIVYSILGICLIACLIYFIFLRLDYLQQIKKNALEVKKNNELHKKLNKILNNSAPIANNINQAVQNDPQVIPEITVDNNFMDKIIKIVEVNYKNVYFNIEEFAQDLHMSRSQLFRKVKTITGQTPYEFLYEFRLKKATYLLTHSELNISEIAYKTGFKSANSFSKTFTKHKGISPRKYKEKLLVNL